MSWKLYRKLQMKGWFTCSSIRRSRMILRTLSDLTTIEEKESEVSETLIHQRAGIQRRQSRCRVHTFIFANVFQSKRQTSVFTLYNSDFAKGTATDDS